MKRITLPLILIICLLVVGSALAGSSDNYRIDWLTPMTGGGGGSASSANYSVNFTVGQSVIGTSSGESHNVCTGFWCDVIAAFKINLPVILSNN